MVWVTFLGEPKKYVVLSEREEVEENPGQTKETEELLGGILRTNGGEVGVEQMNLRNPVQRVSQVGGEMSKGVIKERLEDEAEEVERG